MVKQSIRKFKHDEPDSFQVVDGSVNVFFESSKTMVDYFEQSQSRQISEKKKIMKKRNLPKEQYNKQQKPEQDEDMGVKDLGERVCQRIKALFQKGGFCQQFKNIVKELQKLNKGKVSGKKGMEMLFRHAWLRPKIGQYILSGCLKREIVSSRKRCSISEKVKTNSVRNQVTFYNFIVFSFLQGGIDNFSSLRQPIFGRDYNQKTDIQKDNEVCYMEIQRQNDNIFDVLGMQEGQKQVSGELFFEPVFGGQLEHRNML